MARLTEHGLRRTIGASGLFATAYGNVGSSIYYALGLVASYALGLTPIVFIVTGFIFYLTAATYAEATAMYPEAGGSSSFARHAFNEFWSFFAGWAQMLNYTITVAISAFFVPHYLGGMFWPALAARPRGRAVRQRGGDRPLADQRGRRQGGRGLEHRARDHRPRDAVAAGRDRDRARALAPRARPQRAPRGRAELEELPDRDPDRDDRLHRDRDDLQHGRGGTRRDAHAFRAPSKAS